jgi:hypothetical protein
MMVSISNIGNVIVQEHRNIKHKLLPLRGLQLLKVMLISIYYNTNGIFFIFLISRLLHLYMCS